VSWSADDPGQGDPAIIAGLAAEFQDQADEAAAAARQLRALHANASDALWRGDAANAFRHRIGDLPPHLDKLHSSYQTAADGMRAYAAAVTQIGDDAAGQRQRLAGAESEHASTSSRGVVAARTEWVG
jgi:uncharacterized protein YukE